MDLPAEWEARLLDVLSSDSAPADVVAALASAHSWAFVDGRGLLFSVDNRDDIAIAGQALALSTFHSSSQFEGRTGEPTVSIEHGLKRRVLPLGVKVYPRVDPVMIACVVSPDRSMCLLGKMKSMPKNFYSCLSGFIEVTNEPSSIHNMLVAI